MNHRERKVSQKVDDVQDTPNCNDLRCSFCCHQYQPQCRCEYISCGLGIYEQNTCGHNSLCKSSRQFGTRVARTVHGNLSRVRSQFGRIRSRLSCSGHQLLSYRRLPSGEAVERSQSVDSATITRCQNIAGDDDATLYTMTQETEDFASPPRQQQQQHQRQQRQRERRVYAPEFCLLAGTTANRSNRELDSPSASCRLYLPPRALSNLVPLIRPKNRLSESVTSQEPQPPPQPPPQASPKAPRTPLKARKPPPKSPKPPAPPPPPPPVTVSTSEIVEVIEVAVCATSTTEDALRFVAPPTPTPTLPLLMPPPLPPQPPQVDSRRDSTQSGGEEGQDEGGGGGHGGEVGGRERAASGGGGCCGCGKSRNRPSTCPATIVEVPESQNETTGTSSGRSEEGRADEPTLPSAQSDASAASWVSLYSGPPPPQPSASASDTSKDRPPRPTLPPLPEETTATATATATATGTTSPTWRSTKTPMPTQTEETVVESNAFVGHGDGVYASHRLPPQVPSGVRPTPPSPSPPSTSPTPQQPPSSVVAVADSSVHTLESPVVSSKPVIIASSGSNSGSGSSSSSTWLTQELEISVLQDGQTRYECLLTFTTSEHSGSLVLTSTANSDLPMDEARTGGEDSASWLKVSIEDEEVTCDVASKSNRDNRDPQVRSNSTKTRPSEGTTDQPIKDISSILSQQQQQTPQRQQQTNGPSNCLTIRGPMRPRNGEAVVLTNSENRAMTAVDSARNDRNLPASSFGAAGGCGDGDSSDQSIVYQLASRIVDGADDNTTATTTTGGDIDDRPLLILGNDISGGSWQHQQLCLIQTPPLVLQARAVPSELRDRQFYGQSGRSTPRIHQYLLPTDEAPADLTACQASVRWLSDTATLAHGGGAGSVVAAVAGTRLVTGNQWAGASNTAAASAAAASLTPLELRRNDISTHAPLLARSMLACQCDTGCLAPILSTKFAPDGSAATGAGNATTTATWASTTKAAGGGQPSANWNASNSGSIGGSRSRCKRLLANLLKRGRASPGSSTSPTTRFAELVYASGDSVWLCLPSAATSTAHSLVELAMQETYSYHTGLLTLEEVVQATPSSSSSCGSNNSNCSHLCNTNANNRKRRKTYFTRRCLVRLDERAAILIQEAASQLCIPSAMAVRLGSREVDYNDVRLATTTTVSHSSDGVRSDSGGSGAQDRPECLWPKLAIRGNGGASTRLMLSRFDATISSFIWWSLVPLGVAESEQQRRLRALRRRRRR